MDTALSFPPTAVVANPGACAHQTLVSYTTAIDASSRRASQSAGDAKHGIGVFLAAGVSDGKPNPIRYAFLAGIGGKGVPGRPEDSYGVGFARTQFSSAFIPFLRQRLGLGLNHESALEAYYNVAITGWLNATADLQIIDPALNKTLNSSGRGLANVDTAFVAGIRNRARFWNGRGPLGPSSSADVTAH